MKHTKGPWQVGNLVKNDFELRHVEIMGPDGIKRIAKAIYGQTDEECASNAHLIAAAPELLEACEEVLRCINTKNICEQINSGHAEHLGDAAAKIYKAIKKAERKL